MFLGTALKQYFVRLFGFENHVEEPIKHIFDIPISVYRSAIGNRLGKAAVKRIIIIYYYRFPSAIII